jgi:hypothetical protein
MARRSAIGAMASVMNRYENCQKPHEPCAQFGSMIRTNVPQASATVVDQRARSARSSVGAESGIPTPLIG